MESKRKARRQRHQRKVKRREAKKQLNYIIEFIQKEHKVKRMSVEEFDDEILQPLQEVGKLWYEKTSKENPELLNFVVLLNAHLFTQNPF